MGKTKQKQKNTYSQYSVIGSTNDLQLSEFDETFKLVTFVFTKLLLLLYNKLSEQHLVFHVLLHDFQGTSKLKLSNK